ncbi:MAG: hypothetical protein ACYS9X_06100 [Planctomycetota bacterium]|jgi:hypothetical protein
MQLVFCLACLTMTAWTWMRHSYCWPIDVSVIAEPGCRSEARRPPSQPYLGRFVEVKGTVVDADAYESTSQDELDSGRVLPKRYTTAYLDWEGNDTASGEAILESLTALPERGSQVTLRGRVDSYESLCSHRGIVVHYVLDGTQGRLHPASIAGLVVGAMGVFIFGLYLRRWLRQRKALAGQPGQDMIA